MTYAGTLVVATIVATLNGAAASAERHRGLANILMRIEPDTRLEQVCDIEAMRQIAHVKPFKPDRAKSDIISHPTHDGHAMTASGAAFRSAGRWYAFSFSCRGSADHLRVLSFSFQIHDEIPRARWAGLGLWP